MAGRPRNRKAGAATVHLGLRLTGPEGMLLTALVEDVQRDTPFGSVSASSVVKGLILEAAALRGLRAVQRGKEWRVERHAESIPPTESTSPARHSPQPPRDRFSDVIEEAYGIVPTTHASDARGAAKRHTQTKR
jgi:hypothetical protein